MSAQREDNENCLLPFLWFNYCCKLKMRTKGAVPLVVFSSSGFSEDIIVWPKIEQNFRSGPSSSLINFHLEFCKWERIVHCLCEMGDYSFIFSTGQAMPSNSFICLFFVLLFEFVKWMPCHVNASIPSFPFPSQWERIVHWERRWWENTHPKFGKQEMKVVEWMNSTQRRT